MALYRFLTDEFGYKEEDIVIFGRSIGSGPATELASKTQPGLLILLSAFTSVRRVASELFGAMAYVMPDYFNSLKKIKKLKCPLFLIHGVEDTVIRYEHSTELLESAEENKILVDRASIDDCGHNDLDYATHICPPIIEFMDKLQR